jgi:hypothetical protein
LSRISLELGFFYCLPAEKWFGSTEENELLRFHGNTSHFIALLTATYAVREYKGKLLLDSVATVVTRTHHSVPLYVDCLSA